MTEGNVTGCVSGVVTSKVGQSPGIAVVFMISTSHPLETHITPSPCILKVFDILYMWLVVIWL
jgi:hypothetical protein